MKKLLILALFSVQLFAGFFPIGGGGGGGADFPHNTDIVDMTGGTGAITIDVANRQLTNTGGQETVNWDNEALYHSGNQVMDWSVQQLRTNGGQESVDWGAFLLISPSNQPVVDWNNLYLRDNSSNLSADWGGRRLSNESGTQTVAWGNGSYQLNDSSGNGSLNWGSREAIDGSNLTSIDYGGRTLKDGGTQVAIDWAGRNLNNSSAATILTWSSAVQLAAGTVGAPNLVFAADTTYGWYQPSASVWSFSSNGAQRFSLGLGQQNFTLKDQSVAGSLNVTFDSHILYFEHSATTTNSFYEFLSQDSNTTNLAIGSEVSNGTSWEFSAFQPGSGDSIGGFGIKNLNGPGSAVNSYPYFVNKNSLTGIGIGDENRNNMNVLTVWGVPDITATGTTTVNASTAVTVTSGKLLQQAGVGDLVAVSSASTVFVPITAIASNTAMTVKTAIGNGTSQTLVIKKAIIRGDNSSNVPAFLVDANGEISTQIAGSGLSIKEGTNGRMGVATLVGGTVTVSTTSVRSNSRIFLSEATPGGTQGVLSAPTASIINGTSFVINSSNVLDTSTVNYEIFYPSN